jgi:hypothetical protein
VVFLSGLCAFAVSIFSDIHDGMHPILRFRHGMNFTLNPMRIATGLKSTKTGL